MFDLVKQFQVGSGEPAPYFAKGMRFQGLFGLVYIFLA